MDISQYNETYDPGQDPTKPVPKGVYEIVILGEEEKIAKSGRGEYLQFKIQVLSGPHKGRYVPERLNLVHENETAAEIARRTLAQIKWATGKPAAKDTKELFNIPMKASVDIQEGTGGYGPSNVIRSYDRLTQGSGTAQVAATANLAADAGTEKKNSGGDDPWL